MVQFGGAKPAKKTTYEGPVTASPSKTDFVVKGKGRDTVMDAPQVVTQAYTINQTNYLQLRAIATLFNRTKSQFDIGWDGQYAVIELGKPFSSTVTGSKMQNTRNVRYSDTKFKLNGQVFSFTDARLINGSTNYIQLREFAQKLSGTTSQFNVYWDTALGQAVIQPGAPYVGTKYEVAVTVLEQIRPPLHHHRNESG
ncbi:MAG: copper amine oxidase [Bacillota bacterium]|nr:copper amine oxidase [Bacillota bacterium]